MAQLLLGFAVLAGALWLANYLSRANTARMAGGIKTIGGVGALAGAALLGARGQVGIAVPLGMAGLALLGWLPGLPAGFSQRWNRSPGQASRVATGFVEMELDHDSGDLRGRFVAGTHAGATFETLDLRTLIASLAEIDEESRALVAAYLDRRYPGWREDADPGAAARDGSAPGGPMTQEEAYQILGLQPGAGADDIRRAHRTLMKKLHPDQGGSTYLAARVNQAKDVLLRQHR